MSGEAKSIWPRGGFVDSIVGGLLLLCGTPLADALAPDVKTLQYEFKEQRAGRLSSWYVKIANPTGDAFEVRVAQPKGSNVRADFSMPSKDGSAWLGSLKKGEKLELIYFIDEPSGHISSEAVRDLIVSRYRDRDESTGEMEYRTVEATDRSVTGFTRKLIWSIWFFMPLTIYVIGVVGINWWRDRRKRAGQGPDLKSSA